MTNYRQKKKKQLIYLNNLCNIDISYILYIITVSILLQ